MQELESKVTTICTNRGVSRVLGHVCAHGTSPTDQLLYVSPMSLPQIASSESVGIRCGTPDLTKQILKPEWP